MGRLKRVIIFAGIYACDCVRYRTTRLPGERSAGCILQSTISKIPGMVSAEAGGKIYTFSTADMESKHSAGPVPDI